jgi:hypothetical protein
VSARTCRIHHYALANGQVFNSWAYLLDHRNEFVAQNEGPRWHKATAATMKVVVYVGTTYADTTNP